MRHLTILLIAALSLAVVGCSTRVTSQIPANANLTQQDQVRALSEIQARISPEITGRERKFVASAMLAYWQKTHRVVSKLVIVVPHGDTDEMFANRPEFHNALERYAKVPGRDNLVVSRSGRTLTAPATMAESESPLLASPPIDHGHGPYRRLSTIQGYNATDAEMQLPCSTHFPANGNDNPYVYFSGYGTPNSGSTQIEMGLGYNDAGTSGGNTWTPYINAFGVPYYANNSAIWTPQNGENLWYTCGSTLPAQLFTSFKAIAGCVINTAPMQDLAYMDPAGGNPCQMGYSAYIFLWWDSYEMNTSGTDDINVAFAFSVNTYPYVYNGWQDDCSACTVGLVVALAQSTQKKDSKVFGPVTVGGPTSCCEYYGAIEWYNFYNGSAYASSANTPYCQDYPAWTSNPNTECGDTPGSPLYPTISVTNFDYNEETVTINNSYTYPR